LSNIVESGWVDVLSQRIEFLYDQEAYSF
jgi:hypothetical protein